MELKVLFQRFDIVFVAKNQMKIVIRTLWHNEYKMLTY